jgi:hypothetical protein
MYSLESLKMLKNGELRPWGVGSIKVVLKKFDSNQSVLTILSFGISHE